MTRPNQRVRPHIRAVRTIVGIIVLMGATMWGSVAFFGATGLEQLSPPGAAPSWSVPYLWSVAVVLGLSSLSATLLAWITARSFTQDVRDVESGVARLVREQPVLSDESGMHLKRATPSALPLAPRAHIPVSTLDELGELVVAFDALRSDFRLALQQERELKRRAQEASVGNEAFLKAVSHELRTPLNSILGFADVLLSEMDGPLSDSQREDVRIIASAGRHLQALFNDILDLSAAATGHLELDHQEVALGPLVEEVAAELGSHRKEGVALDVHIDDDVPVLFADPKRLRQVLTNLAGNALKFTDTGFVRIEVERARDWVVLRVSDTGVGIPPEALDEVFAEFDQVVERAGSRRGGSGLGLTIARTLVELHHGTILVKSHKGEGSVFEVRLPAPAAKATS